MKRNKKGFTIVELVIVIAVIAILSAILIPTFVNLTDKANESRIKSEVADANTAFVMDASDGYVGEAEETKAALAKANEAHAEGKKYFVDEIVTHTSTGEHPVKSFYKSKDVISSSVAWDSEGWSTGEGTKWGVVNLEEEVKVPEFSKIKYNIVREGVQYTADEANGGWKKAEGSEILSGSGVYCLKVLSLKEVVVSEDPEVVKETRAFCSDEALYNNCKIVYTLA